MNNLGAKPQDRAVVDPALEKAKSAGTPAVALELPDGKIITGRDRDVMTASAAVIINALKHLAGIDDQIKLISPIVIGPILKLKAINLKAAVPALTLEEALIALSITAVTNPTVEYLLTKIPKLEKSEAHSTVMLDESEAQVYRKLGINITCAPEYR